MRKFSVLLLVATLVFSLAIPCFAYSDTVTVNGVTYPLVTENNGNVVEWFNASDDRQVLVVTFGAAKRMYLIEKGNLIWTYSGTTNYAEVSSGKFAYSQYTHALLTRVY